MLRAPADTLVALAGEHDAYTTMDAAAMAAAVGPLPEPRGRVHVLCSGGGDTPIAAEAAFVARVTGTEAVRVDDVGATRIRAMLTDGSLLDDVDCLVVVAGLDASLATMIGALTDVPVVAVPTSTGQPAAFGGLGALMTLMNSTVARSGGQRDRQRLRRGRLRRPRRPQECPALIPSRARPKSIIAACTGHGRTRRGTCTQTMINSAGGLG